MLMVITSDADLGHLQIAFTSKEYDDLKLHPRQLLGREWVCPTAVLYLAEPCQWRILQPGSSGGDMHARSSCYTVAIFLER